jgi:hypothetical protein
MDVVELLTLEVSVDEDRSFAASRSASVATAPLKTGVAGFWARHEATASANTIKRHEILMPSMIE